MRRSQKSGGLCSYPHDRIELLATNMFVILKMDPAAYSHKLQQFNDSTSPDGPGLG